MKFILTTDIPATKGGGKPPAVVNAARKLVAQANAADSLQVALTEMLGWWNHSEIKFKMCDGGRGGLGETAEYHRIKKLANDALAIAEKGGVS